MPADFGLTVTIAIAVKSVDQCVVTASDRRISFNDIIPAADNATIKTLKLGTRSLALYAGDISSVLPIANCADALLRNSKQRPDWESPDNVRRVMRLAYQSTRNQEIADRFLSHYAITPRQFYKDYLVGTKQFQRNFQDLKQKIENFDLRVHFLIVGVDLLGLPHIAELQNPGNITPHDLTGMWAIGSGDHLAMASLTAHHYPVCGLSAEQLVIPVCDAKFDAETGGGIGPETTVIVIGSSGHWAPVDSRLVARAKRNWQRSRKRLPSPELVGDIRRDLVRQGVKLMQSLPDVYSN